MGNSFTNIHAYNKKGLSQDAVVQRIDDFYHSIGYEVAPEEANTDVNLFIFYKQGSPWITIYEDTCEDLTHEELAKCVERFSRILVMSVAVASVYDGQEASVALGNSREPKKIVTVSDADENSDFGGRFRFSVPPVFEKMAALFNKPSEKNKLYKLWNGNYRYPEEKIAAFVGLLGINKTLATCGYRIYDQKFHRSGRGFARDYNVINRCYNRRGDASGGNEAFLPVMEAVEYDESISAMKEFRAVFRNTMASSKGLSFYVFGKAVDESLRSGQSRAVHVKAVYRDYDGNKHDCIKPFAEVEFVNGQKGLCVKFDEIELVKEEPVEFYMTLKNLPRSGECVRVAVMPTENPKQGQCGVKVDNC